MENDTGTEMFGDTNSDQCWMFPSCLFGNQRKVRAACRTLARNAVRDGTWRERLKSLERRSVLEVPGPIQVAEHHVYPATQHLWRTYWLFDSVAEICYPHNTALYRILAQEGIGELWYCVALLEPIAVNGFNSYFDGYDPVAISAWSHSLFVNFVNWLPELLLLKSRIATLGPPDDDPRDWLWAHAILQVCSQLEIKVESGDYTDRRGPIQALLDSGVITRAGDRFTLSEKYEA